MHDRIGACAEKRGAHGDISEKIEEALPKFAHSKRAMRSIAMHEKKDCAKRERYQ